MLVSPSDVVARAKATIKECTVSEARKFLTPDTLVIDIREPEEFGRGHLPGAVLLPRGLLEFEIHPLVERTCRRFRCRGGGSGYCPLLRYRWPLCAGRRDIDQYGLSQCAVDGWRDRRLGGVAAAD